MTSEWFPRPADRTELEPCPTWFTALPGTTALAPALRPAWFRYFTRWADLVAKVSERDSVPIIGISGSQGSGKSTTTDMLAETLKHRATQPVVLSLDDFYLTRAERFELGQKIHPLLRERGMPGTHDMGMLNEVIDRLTNGERPLLPKFDKGADDRLPAAKSSRPEQPADVVLLEGWCVGCPPRPTWESPEPLNQREQQEDPDGRWREYVDQQLKNDFRRLWQRLDALHFLRTPGFEQVLRWRDQQEQANRDRGAKRAMTSAQVRHYVTAFERLTSRMMETLPAAADLAVYLAPDHSINRVLLRQPDTS